MISGKDLPATKLIEYRDDRQFDLLLEQAERHGRRHGELARTPLVALWKLDRFRLRH